MIDLVQKRHPQLDCDVYVVPNSILMEMSEGDKCVSFVNVPDDNGAFQLFISAEVPYYGLIELIAHESSHMVTYGDEADDHGEAWEKEFDTIHDIWEQNQKDKEKAHKEAEEK